MYKSRKKRNETIINLIFFYIKKKNLKSIRVSLILSKKKTSFGNCTFLELFSLLYYLGKNCKNRHFLGKFGKSSKF